jgi:regulator of sigma E protease
MSFVVGLFALALGAVATVVAFFGARVVVARVLGVRGRSSRVFGFERAAWRGQSLARRLMFALAGPLAVYLLAATLFALAQGIGGRITTDQASLRVSPAPDGRAATAGVKEGDRIVSVDGRPVADWASLKSEVQEHAGEPVRIVVERDGREVELRPVVSDEGKINVGPFREVHSVGAGEAIAYGLREPFVVQREAIVGWLRYFTVHEKAEFVGPVGMARETGKSADASAAQTLGLIGALISYFFGIPLIFAVALFPLAPRASSTGDGAARA